jgi:hypothetical protein
MGGAYEASCTVWVEVEEEKENPNDMMDEDEESIHGCGP